MSCHSEDATLVVGRFGSELGPNPNPSGPNPGSGFRFGYLPEPEPRLGSGFGKFPKFENPFELGSNPEPLINLLVLNYGDLSSIQINSLMYSQPILKM
jgi:hypothetical protein